MFFFDNSDNMDIEKISDRIKQLRIQRKLTQQDLADVIGVSRMTIGSYERHTSIPSLEVLIKISNEYNVSLDWLCGKSEFSKSEQIQNFADVAQRLFEISDVYKIRIIVQEPIPESESTTDDIYFDENELEHIFIEFDTCHVMYKNGRSIDNIEHFLKDWKKMKELYEENVIDKDVYALWKEKTLKQLACEPQNSSRMVKSLTAQNENTDKDVE